MHLLAKRLTGAVRALESLDRHDDYPWAEVSRAARDASLYIAHAVSIRGLWDTLDHLERAALMTARAEGDHLCHQIPPSHLKDRPRERISALVAELAHYGHACDRYQELPWPPADPLRSDRYTLSAEHLKTYQQLPDRWRAGVLYLLARPEETPPEIVRRLETPERDCTAPPHLDELLALATDLKDEAGQASAPPDDGPAPGLRTRYAARLAEQLDVLPTAWQRCALMRMDGTTRSHQALALIHSARSYFAHTYMPLTRRHPGSDRRHRKLFPQEKRKTFVPTGFDLTVPTAARVHNKLRHGKDNYPADRAAVSVLLHHVPRLPQAIAQARAYLHAQVQQAVYLGIEQYVDLGCGLPLHPHGWRDAVHDTAARLHRAHTVYVDNDSGAVAHARTKLITKHSSVADEDLGEAGLLPRLAAAGHLDLDRPVAVLLVNTLEYLSKPTATALLRDLSETLPSGSVLSVATTATGDSDLATRATLAMADAAPSVG